MNCAGKGAYVSFNFLLNYAEKNAKKQTKEKRNKSLEKITMNKLDGRQDSDNSGDESEGNRSYLSVCENDLDKELNYSGEEDNYNEQEEVKKPQLNINKPQKVYRQEVDTNVFKISKSTL